MPDKTLTYIQLAQDTARQITSNYRSWTAYLSTASRLYKYQYSDQTADSCPAPGRYRLCRV